MNAGGRRILANLSILMLLDTLNESLSLPKPEMRWRKVELSSHIT